MHALSVHNTRTTIDEDYHNSDDDDDDDDDENTDQLLESTACTWSMTPTNPFP